MQRLILINGLPGSGKSTIGLMLRDALKPAAFVDTDHLMRVKPWPEDGSIYEETLERALMVAQDFFSRGIPTVVISGCVHSAALFQTVGWTMDLNQVRCVVVALQTEATVRRRRQQERGKEVDVGTEEFSLLPTDVEPAQLITVDSSQHTPEETAQEILQQL